MNAITLGTTAYPVGRVGLLTAEELVGLYAAALGWREGDAGEASGEVSEPLIRRVRCAALAVLLPGLGVEVPRSRDYLALGETVYGVLREQGHPPKAILEAGHQAVEVIRDLVPKTEVVAAASRPTPAPEAVVV